MESNEKPWWGNLEPSKGTKKKEQKKSYLTVLGFTAILATMVSAIMVLPDPNAPKESQFKSIEYPSTAAETVAGCGGTFVFDVPREYTGEIPEGFFNNPYGEGTIDRNIPYNPMLVPAYGYTYKMREEPAKIFWNFPENEEEKNHIPESIEYLSYMWDGWTVIWYDKEVDALSLESLKEFAESHEKTMVLPWVRDDDRKIPLGRKFAFGSWGITRSCELWSADIAESFIENAQKIYNDRDKTRYPAKIDNSGELKLIEVE